MCTIFLASFDDTVNHAPRRRPNIGDMTKMFGTVGSAGQGFSFIGEVNLTGRRLKGLPTMRNASAVRRLMLSHNQLTALDLAAFPNLEWVDCKHNQLTSVDNMSCQLMYVTAQHNQLTQLRLAPWNDRLELIDVSHNALNTDVGLAGVPAPRLRSLNVSHNRLTRWKSFQPSLEVIAMEHNELQDLPEAPYVLKELLVSHNRLEAVPHSYIHCGAQKLDFRANKIRRMPDCAAFEVLAEGCPLQNVFAFRRGTVINMHNIPLPNAALNLSAYGGVIHLTLSGMGLTSLPESIGQLRELKMLNVEHNPLLLSLPSTIGQCRDLQELYVRGTGIRRLPPSLSECVGMTHIECDEPLRAQALLLLRQAEEARRPAPVAPQASPTTGRVSAFTTRPVAQGQSTGGTGQTLLQRWCQITGRPRPELSALTDQQQAMLCEWLQRLQATNDFSWNQAHLCNIVLDMLLFAQQHEPFRTALFAQVACNLECCGDRAAMSLNEAYTAYRIEQLLLALDQGSGTADQAQLLGAVLVEYTGLAKTTCLRKRVAHLLNEHGTQHESVEIYLYCEVKLREKLGLTSAVHQMSHAMLGCPSWLQLGSVEDWVRRNFYSDLFDALESNRARLEPILAGFPWEPTGNWDERLERIDAQNLNSQQYDAAMKNLLRERQEALQAQRRAWLSQSNQSVGGGNVLTRLIEQGMAKLAAPKAVALGEHADNPPESRTWLARLTRALF